MKSSFARHKTTSTIRHGFTLTELLVVLTIIGIVAALLFPVFAKARERAHQTVCTSNLRQIGIALRMYQDDHEGVLPQLFGDASSSPTKERPGFDLLLPYTHDVGIFHCPDADPPPSNQFRLDYRYRVSDLFDIQVNDLRTVHNGIMKPAPLSVLVYDSNHVQGRYTPYRYLVLRADGAVSSVSTARIVGWCYMPNGHWIDWELDPTNPCKHQESVFPDEPWPPQFEK